MPIKAKQRKASDQYYETIERSRQACFTPRQRTVSTKTHTNSVPRTKQQTLTQIDFVFRLPGAAADDADLDYQVAEEPRARKRRKTSLINVVDNSDTSYTPEAQTRTRSRRKAVHEAPTNTTATTCASQLVIDSASISPRPKRRTPRKDSSREVQRPQSTQQLPADLLMAPPRTPQKRRKTEIPSSQSPATTPLSIHYRSPQRDELRSPLKERSINTQLRQLSERGKRKVKGNVPRLHIPDTFDDEDESTGFGAQSNYLLPKLKVQNTFQTETRTSDFSTQVTQSDSVMLGENIDLELEPDHTALDMLPERYTRNYTFLGTSQPLLPVEPMVNDSETEEEQELRTEEDFYAGHDTQAALQYVDNISSIPSSNDNLVPNPVDDFNKAIASAGRKFRPSRRKEAASAVRCSRTAIEGCSPSKRYEVQVAAHFEIAHEITPTTQVPSTPSPPICETHQGFTLPEDDLQQDTQSFTPPSTTIDNLTQPEPTGNKPCKMADVPIKLDGWKTQLTGDYSHTASSSAHASPTSQDTKGIYNQDPHPSLIPSSQATTVDVTQSSLPPLINTNHRRDHISPQRPSKTTPKPSFRSLSHSQSQPELPSNSLDTHNNNHNRNPTFPLLPPLYLFSSSLPLESGDQTQAAGIRGATNLADLDSERLWNGKPLTDSQLLPESLMDWTVPRPPGWESEIEIEMEGEGDE
ncbi:hypothetical protein MMC19_005512 [Ptychographa xylographoides]|nr:hypothetical protein [Ptychographa xylographoides]